MRGLCLVLILLGRLGLASVALRLLGTAVGVDGLARTDGQKAAVQLVVPLSQRHLDGTLAVVLHDAVAPLGNTVEWAGGITFTFLSLLQREGRAGERELVSY